LRRGGIGGGVDRRLGVALAHAVTYCIPHAAGHDGTAAAEPASVLTWGDVLRYGWLVTVWCAVGCWSAPDTIDGFTPEQWAKLQGELALPKLDPCKVAGLDSDCTSAIVLGCELLGDPALSKGAGVSCLTCHDPKNDFIDGRRPNNVSLGAGGAWTKRNAMTLVDVGYKALLAPPNDGVFGWAGGWKDKTAPPEQLTSPGQVLDLALARAMASDYQQVELVVTINGNYFMLYGAAFLTRPDTDSNFTGHIQQAFTAAISTIVAAPTPFDDYLAGRDSTMSDAAKRGFKVFLGKGTCIECHSTPMFSDFQFRNTGVPQYGDNVPSSDIGRGEITGNVADYGKFLTGSLREIARTGPYMHDGVFSSLAEVIDFYRHGGGPSDYPRDPRIVPLDLTDDDASDLEEFLRSLSAPTAPMKCGDLGTPGPPPDAGVGPPDANVSDAYRMPDAPPDAGCAVPGYTMCSGFCYDLQNDPMHCGTCTNSCTAPKPNCAMGTCVH
jgi:cytochrome c peroxidase